MTQKEYFRAIVGVMILGSLAIGMLVNRNALFFTAFIGVNMLQSSVSGFCPLDSLLKKTGLAECPDARTK